MSKYYTINILNEDNNLGSRVTSLAKEGIYVSSTLMFREELESLGISIINEKHVPYSLEWNKNNKLSETELLKYLREKYHIELKEVTALLDFGKISKEIIYNPTSLGYQYLTEEVIKIESNSEVLKEKVLSYLKDIDSKGKTLYITDPYLFQITGKFQEMLIELLEKAEIKKVVAYTERTGLFNDINNKLNSINIELEFIQTDKIHDRFWICPESTKGFVVGTSLNTIGKRIALIDYLQQEDVEEILNVIKDIK